MSNTNPVIADEFLKWDVSHVVFHSPFHADVHYKDEHVDTYVWDKLNKKWIKDAVLAWLTNSLSSTG